MSLHTLTRTMSHDTSAQQLSPTPPTQTSARPSLDIRIETGLANGPAKARMLWREGFTPREMANNSLDERQVRRQEVIFEIIHTEADYIKDLRILVDIFVQPMRFLKVATSQQCDLMFSNIEEILALHESINAAFMERQRREYPVVSDIADELLPFVSQFKVYAKYICNQDNALKLVEELKKESAHFMVFWKERQGRPECRSLPLESFMVLPFQRLLKYPLLLQTLLAATDEWSQEYANGRMVIEQIDAWIKKIQDTQAKLDSYACLDALSKSIRDIDWTPYMSGEHRLVYSGPVKTSVPRVGSGQPDLLSTEEPGVMWLFDSFLVIAKPSSPGGPRAPAQPTKPQSAKPLPGTRYTAVLGPCQVVEILDIAHYKGAPGVYLHVIPVQSPTMTPQMDSLVVRFSTKAEYTAWKPKLDEHVMHTLNSPTPHMDSLMADFARASISHTRPTSGSSLASPSQSCFGSSVNASVSEIPTISLRDVYVPFPAPQPKSKIRRGWEFLRSKTENITSRSLKRQLKKYGGGGGKRRATDPPLAPPSQVKELRRISRPVTARNSSQPISTPIMPGSTDFVHVSPVIAPSAANGGRGDAPALGIYRANGSRELSSLDTVVLKSYSNYSCRRSEEASTHSPTSDKHFKFEVGSATLCGDSSSSNSNTLTSSFSPIAVRPSRLNIEAVDLDLDSETSSIELTPVYSEHTPKFRTLHGAAPYVKPLPVPKRRVSRVAGGARKPAPRFEIGSAKLTYGDVPKPPVAWQQQQQQQQQQHQQNQPPKQPVSLGVPNTNSTHSRSISWYTSVSAVRPTLRKWSVGDALQKPSMEQLSGPYQMVYHPVPEEQGQEPQRDPRFRAAYTLGRYHNRMERRNTNA